MIRVSPNTLTSNKKHVLLATLVPLNVGPQDVVMFCGLPAKYVVRRLTVFDASTSLAGSAATLALYTASFAGGTNIVVAATITGLTAAAKWVNMTLAAVLGTDYMTSSHLFLRNVARHAGAATVSVQLELDDLT